MNDENVLFKYTSQLVDCLVSMGKPYQLEAVTREVIVWFINSVVYYSVV